jgi:serine/threonine-protein kinase
MSPEQLSAGDVDPRSDVFALGVVLFQALAGVLPFDAPTLEALAVRVLTGELPPLQSMRPDLPPALVEVVGRALARRREERTPTAKALADALSPFRAAVPLPNSSALGHAATVLSVAPGASGGAPIAAMPSFPPGVKRARRMLFSIAGGTIGILLAVAVGLVLAHSRSGSLASATAAPSNASASASTRVAPPAVSLAPAVDWAVAASAARSSPALEAHKAGPGSTAPTVPSASASGARPSPAQNLGLSEDNPFR